MTKSGETVAADVRRRSFPKNSQFCVPPPHVGGYFVTGPVNGVGCSFATLTSPCSREMLPSLRHENPCNVRRGPEPDHSPYVCRLGARGYLCSRDSG